ncbi:FUSC family protein [Tsukamurella strandjordii]|uniref:FUSC family protein n=1 Tax=Tsukamurella strandjordii TaxID=147577 RepID=UPI003CD0C2DF
MTAGEPNHDPLPPVSRVRSLVFAQSAAGPWRWGAGLRAAAAVGIPGAGMVAAGHGSSALFATFGAFAVLYGEGRAYRIRAQVVGIAGIALLLSVIVGTALGSVIPESSVPIRIASVLMVVVPAVLAVYVVDALRLGPPGALFFALVGSGAVIATEAGAGAASLVVGTALGVVSSVVVSMAGALRDPSRPQREAVNRAVGAVDAYLAPDGARTATQRNAAGSALIAAWSTMDDARAGARSADAPLLERLRDANHRFTATQVDTVESAGVDPTREVTTSTMRPSIGHRLRRSLTMSSHAMVTAVRVGVACTAAGAASLALGFDRPHWAAISALVVLQSGVDRVHGTVRGLQRFMGTAVGLALYAALYGLGPTGYALIAIVAVLQFCIEMMITRNYAAAVTFITPVALMASGAGATTGSAGPVIRDRLLETVIGVIVAFLAMYFLYPNTHRRTFEWTAQRVRSTALALVDRPDEVGAEPAREQARCLHFEVEGCVRAGIDSAHNEPEWTDQHWPAQARLVHSGYDLLSAFWTAPHDRPLLDGAAWKQRFGNGRE